jgi:hypothetical protein
VVLNSKAEQVEVALDWKAEDHPSLVGERIFEVVLALLVGLHLEL